MNNLANDSIHATPIAAWLAEGQSSQRDMLESLQNLKSKSSAPFNIIASHRHNRPEIFEFADSVYREPSMLLAYGLFRNSIFNFYTDHNRAYLAGCYLL